MRVLMFGWEFPPHIAGGLGTACYGLTRTWLLEHYVKAKFDVQGKGFIAKAEEILDGFADELNTYGIGSIGEIFDGDPPHHSRGSISQAWSVGAVLRIKEMVDKYKRKRK